MDRKAHFAALIASGCISLAFPMSAFAWNLLERQLDPSLNFYDLPAEWDKQKVTIIRFPQYGAQLITRDEVRQDKVMALLRDAQQLSAQNKHAEALKKLHEVDGMVDRASVESYLVERMRLAVAYRAGDKTLALQAALAAMATGLAPANETWLIEDYIARAYYNQKAFAQAIPWFNRYIKDGGNEQVMREALVKSYYLTGDYAQASAQAHNIIDADEKAGRTPTEAMLNIWLDSSDKLNNPTQYVAALEKTASYYPSKEYWAELLNRVISSSKFDEELSFDTYRFMYATGQIDSTDDYTGMALSALRTRHPGQAKRVLEQGFQKTALGRGADAAKHKQMLAVATREATAETASLESTAAAALRDNSGDALVYAGERYIDAGQAEKGLDLITRGIKAGKLKNPDGAKLRLGFAYAYAGRVPEALQTWRQIEGSDGAVDLARYWRLFFENRTRANALQKVSLQ